jgi:predicted nucleic acid-binding protein
MDPVLACFMSRMEQAATLKACQPLSVAEAWIAAAAHLEGAVLVHRDPGFRALAQRPQEWLS